MAAYFTGEYAAIVLFGLIDFQLNPHFNFVFYATRNFARFFCFFANGITESFNSFMSNKYRIPYINACIRAFAKRFKLSARTAFEYLYQFKGIDFLIEFYEIEHLQSIDDAVDDLVVCCSNNGGTLR